MLPSIIEAPKWADQNKLSTGIKNLDSNLGGGFPTNGIIEIGGESGSGKSQLCLQLSLTAQKNIIDGGLNGSVVYICTESAFPSKRLHQLITTSGSDKNVGSNIYVEHVSDYFNLKECLLNKLPRLIEIKNVKLLIIDSVAALFRGTYNLTEGQARTQDMRELGGILLKFNAKYNMCVITVNQATACLNSNITVPALGLAWCNLVTTRIQLSRLNDSHRMLQILFSPMLPELTHYFDITSTGLTDTE